jgi:cyclophilin family peptidyl-prolyl cis-trans isomerase
MWDRIRIGRTQGGRLGDGAGARAGRRSARQPSVESLEGRQLMTASLAPVSNLTVPSQQGYTLPLNGSANTNAQTFTVTSSNPDIAASIVSGPYWTVNVQYTDPTNPQNNFSGPLVFQLFNNAGTTTLTPNTVSHIEQFTNDGYYTTTGKYITRVATGFPGATDYVVQGGAPSPNGTGNSGQPNTPFANENVQQLAFTGTNQLAMANAGGTNSNDTQFFITTGSPNNELGYNYSIFGQLVSGQSTLAQLTQIPVTTNPNLGNENSLPVHSPIFSAVSLSNANPNGVALIDTTQSKSGETATITVTATDPTDGSTATQSFTVTVGAYQGPTSPAINFRPLATPATATAPQGQSTKVTLSGTSGYPDSTKPATLSYALVSQPAHGTIANFNPTTGTLNYTPSPGFSGTDTFQFQVNSSGPQATPATTASSPATITITVSPTPPVNTGAVRVVGPVLIITPLPHVGHKTNIINVVQTPSTSSSGTPVIQVFVNGQLDINQPDLNTIDSIVAFGSKASDRITIDPSVTIPSLIDGGHGGRNVLKGGGSETREHGWFGFNTLVGGTGPNQLIGRAGQVKFKPSSATTLIFAGTPGQSSSAPPTGTFYVYKKGRLIPVPLSNLYPHATSTGTTHSGTHKKKK